MLTLPNNKTTQPQEYIFLAIFYTPKNARKFPTDIRKSIAFPYTTTSENKGMLYLLRIAPLKKKPILFYNI